MDALTLSRLQFTLTISFHYIYPPMSIGLGVMLVLGGQSERVVFAKAEA